MLEKTFGHVFFRQRDAQSCFPGKVSPVQYKINAMYALKFGSKSQIGYQIGY